MLGNHAWSTPSLDIWRPQGPEGRVDLCRGSLSLHTGLISSLEGFRGLRETGVLTVTVYYTGRMQLEIIRWSSGNCRYDLSVAMSPCTQWAVLNLPSYRPWWHLWSFANWGSSREPWCPEISLGNQSHRNTAPHRLTLVTQSPVCHSEVKLWSRVQDSCHKSHC